MPETTRDRNCTKIVYGRIRIRTSHGERGSGINRHRNGEFESLELRVRYISIDVNMVYLVQHFELNFFHSGFCWRM